jgi:hypothetical protein
MGTSLKVWSKTLLFRSFHVLSYYVLQIQLDTVIGYVELVAVFYIYHTADIFWLILSH